MPSRPMTMNSAGNGATPLRWKSLSHNDFELIAV
jgi:hypothetical protein